MSNPEIKNSLENKEKVNTPVVTKPSRIAGIISALCIAALLGVNFMEPVIASGQSPTTVTSVLSSKEISSDQPKVEIICTDGEPKGIELSGKIPIGTEGASFLIMEIFPEIPRNRADELRGTISSRVDTYGRGVVFNYMEPANGNIVPFFVTIDEEAISIYDNGEDNIYRPLFLWNGGKYQIFIFSGSGKGRTPPFEMTAEELIVATDVFVFECSESLPKYPAVEQNGAGNVYLFIPSERYFARVPHVDKSANVI